MTDNKSPYDIAKDAREAADREYKRIDADPNLSLAGKRAAMAPVAAKLAAQIDQLKWQCDTYREQRVRELKRQALGVLDTNDPGSVLSFRDAMDRAAQISDPNHALKTMQRAIEGGDVVMSRALFQAAIDHGWQVVANEYVAENPVAGDMMVEINSLAPTAERALRDAAYFRLDLPAPLANLTRQQVDSLAEQQAAAVSQ